MQSKSLKSFVLLSSQLFFIFAIFATGPFFPENSLLLIVEVAGILLGLWAVATMVKESKFNAFPDLVKESKLLTSGPYSFIRNPMYTSIILILAPLVIQHPTSSRSLFLLGEILVLIEKIKYEEGALTGKIDGYKEYKKRTKRLVPFIY